MKTQSTNCLTWTKVTYGGTRFYATCEHEDLDVTGRISLPTPLNDKKKRLTVEFSLAFKPVTAKGLTQYNETCYKYESPFVSYYITITK